MNLHVFKIFKTKSRYTNYKRTDRREQRRELPCSIKSL